MECPQPLLMFLVYFLYVLFLMFSVITHIVLDWRSGSLLFKKMRWVNIPELSESHFWALDQAVDEQIWEMHKYNFKCQGKCEFLKQLRIDQ